jgi:hypothetical protein
MYLNIQEQDQLGGESQIMPIIPGKVDQLMNDFIKKVNADMLSPVNQGTGYTGNSVPTGELYILSQSNSPGQISQSTYSNWQAKVYSNVGPFSEPIITNAMDAIRDRGQGEADFLQLSYNASNNVFDKVRSMVATTQILTNEQNNPDFGFKNFMYAGMTAYFDGRLGDISPGSMVVGKADTWWLNMPNELPKMRNQPLRLPGTATMEYFYSYILALGNSNPGCNALITGIQ